ncbi:hypothetical protein V1264_012056 [Littorina saxatilis]|uniref:Uncharacterized protein n=1 Tax=Littorina saxatilis TaxID=31220 RepID=A0AAN9GN19_9CAEN
MVVTTLIQFLTSHKNVKQQYCSLFHKQSIAICMKMKSQKHSPNTQLNYMHTQSLKLKCAQVSTPALQTVQSEFTKKKRAGLLPLHVEYLVIAYNYSDGGDRG